MGDTKVFCRRAILLDDLWNFPTIVAFRARISELRQERRQIGYRHLLKKTGLTSDAMIAEESFRKLNAPVVEKVAEARPIVALLPLINDSTPVQNPHWPTREDIALGSNRAPAGRVA
jgi:hypothetical protein